MTAILTICGFLALYVVARRMVLLKRDDDFGFRSQKKSFWQKLFGK